MCSGDPTLVPGGLRGYRTWTWEPTRGPLRSRGYPWTGGELRALCDIGGEHDAPFVGCACGVYGWYRPDDSRLIPGVVFGAVEASGRVLLGDYGFRAERVRVCALVTSWPPLVEWCEQHGIAVFRTRDALVAEFPPDDVDELIGHPVPAGPQEGTLAYAGQQFNDALSALSSLLMRDVQLLIHQVGPVWAQAKEQLAPVVERFFEGGRR